MKVSIVGYGFVGQALHKGLKNDVEICIVDPKQGTTFDDLKRFSPEISFICVPTPMNDDGTQNISIIESVLKDFKSNSLNSLIVIKSTVLPNYLSSLESIFPSIVYNPEFLREAHAVEDFINSQLIIFGGKKSDSKILGNFYDKYTKCINKDYQYTDLITASLIKYSINSFLATKVIFFNEINTLFSNIHPNGNWEDFIKLISIDNRIGNSHMQVPGPDNRYGFGGACFPKDTAALLEFAQSNNVSLEVIKTVINLNNSIRSQYQEQNQREIEQNISFNKEIE